MYHLLLNIAPGDTHFQDVEALEDRALSLLAEYGAERLFCLRHLDGSGETQLFAFPSEEEFGRYRQDPRWHSARHRPELAAMRTAVWPVAMI
ncbi:hypothetical protein [Oceanicola sp. S124]|uniref:hypothetical protein n=1 Tax=Oceanicola sp. S124 TaxID=1042378 RepID=UPI00025589E8|nr:hypothetical protein [Oceanicola sp. S124]